MSGESRWLLPDGVDELIPPFAAELESLRRRVIDLMAGWGYRLCMPPLVEFLDSLLSGLGEDLEIQTFKLTDQVSGRMMGIPADMTPQVARIDAHRLPTDCPQRLCYIGPVLHTRPDRFAGSRNPLQLGAELYGHAGIESDAEVICLLVETLACAGVPDLTLEIGHMGVFKALVDAARLDTPGSDRVLDALLRKSPDELEDALRAIGVERALAQFGTNSGGGYTDQHAREYLIRNIGQTMSLEALGRTVIGSQQNQPVLLRQVADVSYAARTKRGEALARCSRPIAWCGCERRGTGAPGGDARGTAGRRHRP